MTCTYCGAVVNVSAPAPPPPMQAQMPPPMQVQMPVVLPAPMVHVADPTDPARLKRLIWIIVISTVAPLLVGGIITVIALAGTCAAVGAAGVAASSAPGTFGGGWDGSMPLVCSGNQQVTATGVTASFPSGTAVTAMGNCQVTLVQCTISAPMAIVTSGNAQVILQGGSVQGAAFAVNASGNSQVVSQGAQVVGAVNRAGNAQVSGM